MTLSRVNLAEVTAVPWANGRGTTRELVRRQTPDGRLLCRVSVADVVDPGPFSPFPGLDRVLVAIDGPGFILSVDGRVVSVAPLVPIAFTGEATVAVTTIEAPSRDLNVMTDRQVARASVATYHNTFAVPRQGERYVFVVEGVFVTDLDTPPLVGGDLLALPAPDEGPSHLTGEGIAIIISILPN